MCKENPCLSTVLRDLEKVWERSHNHNYIITVILQRSLTHSFFISAIDLWLKWISAQNKISVKI